MRLLRYGFSLVGFVVWTGLVGSAIPLQAQSDAPAASADDRQALQDQRIQQLQNKLQEIERELIKLKAANAADLGARHITTAKASGPPPSAISSALKVEQVTVVNPPVPNAEPFAFADFTWLNGNARTKDTPYATKFFTPEIRADVDYTYDFRHPQDDTIGGSSEIFRSNEVQLTQLGVGGDFHYDNVRARLMTQFGLYSQTTPRNDASPARGQWNLADAYRYVSEAYGGYHFNVQHGVNVDAGIFMSYVGLFCYYQFDNWAYQPSYVSSNTPWFFNGVRVQWFPTGKLKIEPWFVNGWQSYGRFNNRPGHRGTDSLPAQRQLVDSRQPVCVGRDALGVAEPHPLSHG